MMKPIRGDYLQTSYRKSALEMNRESQARIRSERETEASLKEKQLKHDEQKKFEILKVLNLLEQTKLSKRDVVRGLKKSDANQEEGNNEE